MSSASCAKFLAGPPYYGHSEFSNLQSVKKILGEKKVFDFKQKCWGTHDLGVLAALIASKLWLPAGFEDGVSANILRKAALALRDRRIVEWQEAELVRQEQLRIQAAAAAEAMAKAAKAAKASKADKAKAKAPPPPPAAVAAAAPPKSWLEKQKEKESRMSNKSTASEIDECARLGFTDLAVLYGMTRIDLGPAMSLSTHGRLLRWCLFLEEQARQEAPRELYFDKSALQPYKDAAKREFVQRLNSDSLIWKQQQKV